MFAREGASLSIACMEAERKDAEAVKTEIESSEYSKGAKVNLIFCDLSIPGDSEAKRIVEEHKAAFGGKLHVLVNNAAQQVQCMDIQEIDMDTVQRTLQISACRAGLLSLRCPSTYPLHRHHRRRRHVCPHQARPAADEEGLGDHQHDVGHRLQGVHSLPVLAPGSVPDPRASSLKGSGGFADYAATKGAILSFTRSLAVQLAPKGIRANSVAPYAPDPFL
jgi:NAD(P)-dependent dehydrogenase (short-subunit alcohol dehydrogenase family)